MPSKKVDLDTLGDDEDMYGNNAAFRCPRATCGKVFIANTTRMNAGAKVCPKCGKSKVTLTAAGGLGTKVLGALIEWD